jgi:5-methylcytosine-specific restriction endonuclease McrA
VRESRRWFSPQRRAKLQKSTPARRRIPKEILCAVLARDRFACRYCGQPLVVWRGPNMATMDHVIPVAQRGPTTVANLVTACGPCNRRKGNCTPEQAGMPLIPLEELCRLAS